MKYFTLFTGTLICCLTTMSAQAYRGEDLAKGAKLSIIEARAIAQKTYPGILVDEQLEKLKGGSGDRKNIRRQIR
jgi:hypothetical protein